MADREMVRSGGRTGEVVLFLWRILGLLVECGVSAADWHNIGTDGRRDGMDQAGCMDYQGVTLPWKLTCQRTRVNLAQAGIKLLLYEVTPSVSSSSLVAGS
jgi:hypothetical protein